MNPVFVVSGRPSPAEQLKAFLSKARQNIFLFSPYVKVDPLRELLSITNVDVTLVTKLSERDVVLGASDVDLFPLCNEIGVKLLIRNDLHLKAFVTDWEAIFLGSSNITASGLGMRSGANYELNVIENSLTLDTKNYLQNLIDGATEMNEELFDRFSDSVASMQAPQIQEDSCLVNYLPKKNYLVSALPMSRTIDEFYQSYAAAYNTKNPTVDACARHDAKTFNVREGLVKVKVLEELQTQFFQSSFIRDLLTYIDQEPRYFGSVKAWIQNNCDDVPVPSRRDLTGNVQVLYQWISELSDGRYEIDRPNYSERIRRVSPL